ncbi:MAG: DUF1015 domain-containing protein, partial [Bacteroidetes bacterium]|nr:DUF1015 domain-containing protein [Bacteroidota bacterium]
QTMGDRTQYGLVGCASVEEYWDNTIKKHEHTRKDKEEDRCNHVRITNAHTGPIFLTYPDNKDIDVVVDKIRETPPTTDHVAPDGIRHQTWVIADADTISRLRTLFSGIPSLYVADGHHRSAAAAIVGRERAQAHSAHTGDEEYNFFLAVYFPAGQLRIMDYNRLVKDLNGLSEEELKAALSRHFTMHPADGPVHPPRKGTFGMYLNTNWYRLEAEPVLLQQSDPVQRLDVAIMQNNILSPILGITDPRTDRRIDFVGGIRGLDELERRVQSGEMTVAFSMHPTSINELMAIADAGQVMPPKSTWFEPKLRDGLFVHFLD